MRPAKGKFAAVLLMVLGLAGGGTAKDGQRPPLRVGQVIIVGNTKTRDSVILEYVQLFPGQILSLPDLRAAERRLARSGLFEVRPTVRVVGPEDPGPFRDILIRVKEK
jgi:outer membrane protein assembly factor BamA